MASGWNKWLHNIHYNHNNQDRDTSLNKSVYNNNNFSSQKFKYFVKNYKAVMGKFSAIFNHWSL